VPRKVDYHPLSIPVPYYHSNVDSDEVMFYVDGDYEARKGSGIGKGSISLHPGGHAHGPQPGAMERSIGVDYSTNSPSWSTPSNHSTWVRRPSPATTAAMPNPGALALPRLARMSIAPVEQEVTSAGTDVEFDVPWITLVWNDPVNLMSYVTYVFQSYFGYSREKAESLMLDVHTKGRAVVATGPREKMEIHTEALHGFGLWATFQKDN
jgi:ATP-dependent Clp protease adaptor protein ClpS